MSRDVYYNAIGDKVYPDECETTEPASSCKSGLLPCPFCGKPGKFGRERSLFNGGKIMYFVECSNDIDSCEAHPSTALWANKRMAVETWNTRAG